jgi:hypothetical protein
MSFVQRFFKAVLPDGMARQMEAESRSWFMRCEECNAERSVWDAGGIRWKASGNPRRRLACAGCGRNTWQETFRKKG